MDPAVLNQFNTTVNSGLQVFDTPIGSQLLKLFLVLYGGLAAPSLTPKTSQWFSNTYVRVLVLVLILWVINRDPSFSILMAAVYLISLHFSTKNAIKEVATNGGIVTPEVSIIVSGGSGISVKPSQVIKEEAKVMQESVIEHKFNPPFADVGKVSVKTPASQSGGLDIPQAMEADGTAHYDVIPEALLAPSPPASQPASSSPPLPKVPSGVEANVPTMTTETVPDIPDAYESDVLATLAEVPQ